MLHSLWIPQRVEKYYSGVVESNDFGSDASGFESLFEYLYLDYVGKPI